MRAPDIDLEELEEMRKKNFRDRLDFISRYTRWLKKTSNKEWSSEQKKIIN